MTSYEKHPQGLSIGKTPSMSVVILARFVWTDECTQGVLEFKGDEDKGDEAGPKSDIYTLTVLNDNVLRQKDKRVNFAEFSTSA